MKTVTFNLRQQAYDRIRDLLKSGEMGPGARVSSLELSRRLGISRTPVREALSRLCADGVVRKVPGFGVCIHKPDADELRELYGMREVLETLVLGLNFASSSPGVVLRRFGGLPAVKATMELLGVPCGPLMQPLRTVSELDRHLLFDALLQAWPEVNEVMSGTPLETAALQSADGQSAAGRHR